jgi:hypothetical protein
VGLRGPRGFGRSGSTTHHGPANCNFLAFGVESGTQKTLDRLDKRQTLAQIEHAVSEAKRCGIERAHGFFLVGSPGETEPDILKSFRFAARLKLDTFGFNRLCVYRGTPLWQEYLDRGILDDHRDWDKRFKCSDIDPTVLPSETVNRARQKGYALLFAHRLFCRPWRTWKLLRTLARHMKVCDIFKLLASPFRRRKLNRKPELPARMLDLGLSAPVRSVSWESRATQRPAGRRRHTEWRRGATALRPGTVFGSVAVATTATVPAFTTIPAPAASAST